MEIPEKVLLNLQAMDGRIRWMHEWLDSQPRMPEPDWSKAPEKANWWAVDGYQTVTGYWHSWWYVKKPTLDQVNTCWDSLNRIYAGAVDLEIGIDWRGTLRKRPEGK